MAWKLWAGLDRAENFRPVHISNLEDVGYLSPSAIFWPSTFMGWFRPVVLSGPPVRWEALVAVLLDNCHNVVFGILLHRSRGLSDLSYFLILSCIVLYCMLCFVSVCAVQAGCDLHLIPAVSGEWRLHDEASGVRQLVVSYPCDVAGWQRIVD